MSTTAQRGHLCQGTDTPLRLAVGVMSRPANADQRAAVRRTWAAEDPSVLSCFVIGVQLKRTPVSPWAPEKKKKMDRMQATLPRGQITGHPGLFALQRERSAFGDVLLLNGSAEIANGGTSGLKTLPWWQHAATNLPGAEWVGKADDDTFVNVPTLLLRLPSSPSPQAILGTIKCANIAATAPRHYLSHPFPTPLSPPTHPSGAMTHQTTAHHRIRCHCHHRNCCCFTCMSHTEGAFQHEHIAYSSAGGPATPQSAISTSVLHMEHSAANPNLQCHVMRASQKVSQAPTRVHMLLHMAGFML